jgi:Predicted acetyltransferases and hydrolases with the alpha/beta hydrolase fold
MTDYNNKQQFSYNTVPTSQNNVQTLHIEKERLVVPIIFIPGVMGSNLKVKPKKGKDGKTKMVWRLDSKMSASGWAVWKAGGAEARKKELNPDRTEVDSRGTYIEAAAKDIATVEQEYFSKIGTLNDNQIDEYDQAYKVMIYETNNAKKNNPENILFGLRGERGWGSVSYISYGEFLDTLQTSLFDPSGNSPTKLTDLIKDKSFILEEKSKAKLTFTDIEATHCESFYLPVHAMGYNWLESNEMSAIRLKTLVEQTLPAYYKKRGKICEKVILVTHSMGGLVARYYTQALGGKDKVLGVINGVQPSTGAVAAYTRMKRGTEVYGGDLVSNWAMANVLGKDAAEMTAVCGQAPGPLQLLPTPEYGGNWLTITEPDGTESHFGANPYTDIYLAKDKWWCACEPHLINPLNSKHDLELMKSDWNRYVRLIEKKVIPFNEAIANQYHPNTYVFLVSKIMMIRLNNNI